MSQPIYSTSVQIPLFSGLNQTGDGYNQKMQYAGIIIPVAYLQIAQNSASKYRKVLDKAINLVIDNA